MQITDDKVFNKIPSLELPPPQRCVKIAQALIILITCLGVAACITAGILFPTLPTLIIIGGVFSALISIVLLVILIKKVLLELRKNNDTIIKGINLLRYEGNQFEHQQNNISDSFTDLNQKYQDLNKQYTKDKQYVQTTLDGYKKSLDNLNKDLDSIREQISKNAASLEILNPSNKKGFISKIKAKDSPAPTNT
ncbi:DUF2975 domain-containing protein [Chlamydia crocodili]|uniref:DUF2975 domain-containing protein n=1 Tax=Chlamydia crocodili TaxID=2766982 RepID=A0ABX8CGW3_9CHLA|nr:DUF2975 domain-containing protein [Chlamydia crocodili]QVE49226.1 DUF2975 domain-containing protein [Chlamydia crocodili]